MDIGMIIDLIISSVGLIAAIFGFIIIFAKDTNYIKLLNEKLPVKLKWILWSGYSILFVLVIYRLALRVFKRG